MKYKHVILVYLSLAPLLLAMAGCTTLSLISPSFTYNNNYNSSNNPNMISCNDGTWFTSPYCSIPIAKFVTLTAKYADPSPKNILMDYDLKHGNFIFYDLNQPKIIDQLNSEFLKNFPEIDKYAAMPNPLQSLYTKVKENYIPHKNYQKLMEAYIYIYTISTLHFATSPCPTPDYGGGAFLAAESLTYQQQYVLYRAFSIQFTNYVLFNLSDSVDGKYKDERDLYNTVYAKILKLNPYRLVRLAQDLYEQTTVYLPQTESGFYNNGLNFGELGTFSCNKYGTSWYRFGFEFFGNNISGIHRLVHFKEQDKLENMDKSKFNLGESLI